jgi:hypothetical protein
MSEFRAGTPTVGQALGPVIQKIAQMPVPQAAAIAGTVLGGVIGQRKPKFGPQPSSGPLAPTREASPAIAMEGRGGGLTPQSTQLAVREALAQRGYSPAAQAAIMGNVQQESRFDPRATGDQGTAHGLFQYRGDRFGNLNKYAQSKGLDPYSPGTQVGFMDQEVTAMPGLKQRLNQSDPASGALLFGKQYERPRVVEPSRAANAERFYKGSQQMAGGPVQTGNYKGQEYSYQTQPASQQPPPQVPQVPQVAQQTPGPYPTVDSSTGKQGYGQKPDSPQPSGGFQPPQQAPAPKLMEAPQPTQPLPMGAQQSQPFQPQAAPDLSQHPLIHDERHLQSLKPGSFFRTPDGKLKIVPEQSEAGV